LSHLELEYSGSATTEGDYPRWRVPEIAVAGRSNAGKSSLLNSIAGRRNLARVSKTPGRTQRLHFFFDKRAELALVDLPGYGFAKASKQDRARFAEAVERYLTSRENLRALLLVMDIRRVPEDDERLLVDFTSSRGLGLTLVATKVDKLRRAERGRRLRELERATGAAWIEFSAETGEGRERVIEALLLVRRSAVAPGD